VVVFSLFWHFFSPVFEISDFLGGSGFLIFWRFLTLFCHFLSTFWHFWHFFTFFRVSLANGHPFLTKTQRPPDVSNTTFWRKLTKNPLLQGKSGQKTHFSTKKREIRPSKMTPPSKKLTPGCVCMYIYIYKLSQKPPPQIFLQGLKFYWFLGSGFQILVTPDSQLFGPRFLISEMPISFLDAGHFFGCRFIISEMPISNF